MARSISTPTDIFAAYETYARDLMEGRVNLDMADVRMYGENASTMTAAQAEADSAEMAGMLLFGESGVGYADPASLSSVREYTQQVADMLAQTRGLAQSATQASDAQLQSQATTLVDEMISQFDAIIAANPAAASYLPSTAAEQDIYRGSIGEAFLAMQDARNAFSDILSGNVDAGDFAVAAASGLRAATTIMKALPLPPAAKSAANAVHMATFLVPGIVAAANGDGDLQELLTIELQTALSIASWGVTDYFFYYIAPIIVSAAVSALDGSKGPIDLSTTAISQGLIEAAVHDNGGTLPDWWYSATGGGSNSSSGNSAALDQAITIAQSLNGVVDNLYASIAAQYGNADFYQELTLTLSPHLGPQEYVFARVGGSPRNPFFYASSDGGTNPWTMIQNSPLFQDGLLDGVNIFGYPVRSIHDSNALYVLEADTPLTSFSANYDTAYAYDGQSYNLLAGDDRFTLRQDADGRPGHNSANHYATAALTAVNGGEGTDVLDLTLLTGAVQAGSTGDLVIDHNSVSYLTWNTPVTGIGNQQQILAHTGIETIIATDFRLIDMSNAAHGVKIITQNAGNATETTEIYGSRHGDTIIVDTARSSIAPNPIDPRFSYVDWINRNITVNAGDGHDYVAGEMINGTSYNGGNGIDTFEILLPDSRGTTHYTTSLDLESGVAWTHWWVDAAGYTWHRENRTDTSTVTNFEWAVGSATGDNIYALNSCSRIQGMGGHDNLVGRGGDDQLMGGAGNDAISGGEGTNRLEGGAGHDVITTPSGTSEIDAGAGDDFVTTADGHASVTLGSGNDAALTGTGNDTIHLGAGLDEVIAGDGDDVITDIYSTGAVWSRYSSIAPGSQFTTYPSHRNAVIDGGAGDDSLAITYGGGDIVFEDHATFNSANFSYDIITGTREAFTYTWVYDDPENPVPLEGTWQPVYRYQEVRNIEELVLTGANFTIDLISYADRQDDFWPSISGYNIHNRVETGDGNDTVTLGAGNDTFYVNLGSDRADGEEGSDTLDFSRLGSDVTVDLSNLTGDGSWTVDIHDTSGAVVGTDTFSGFENVTGTAAGEVITLDAGSNLIRGLGGNDTLRGGADLDRFAFGTDDGADLLSDISLGERLLFNGPVGTAAPSLTRSGSVGRYDYVVNFGNTTVSFSSPDLLDLNAASTTIDGQTTWDMLLVEGALVANDDSGIGFEADEDTAFITGDVLANDTDPGETTAVVTSVDATSSGGASVTHVTGTGTFTYDPNGAYEHLSDGETATDTFTYTISDSGSFSSATVTVQVTGVNDAPVTVADTATAAEDASVDIDVLANDHDVDQSDILSIAGFSNGSNGVVTQNADGTLRYTPNADFNEADSFTYTVSDGHVTREETVNITVTPVADAIVTQEDAVNLTVLNGNRSIDVNPLANDTHVAGTLSISTIGQPTNGTAVLNNNGTVRYTANDGFSGVDTFSYDVISTSGAVATETVTVNLQANQAPVVNGNYRYRGTEETPFTFDPLPYAYDPNGDPLTVTFAEEYYWDRSTVVLNADGTITVTPHDIYNGYVDILVTVSDGELSTTGWYTIEFLNTQDAPIGVDDHIQINPGVTTWMNVLANDPDPDRVFPGFQMEVRYITGFTPVGETASNATAEMSINGLSVTPNADFIGVLTYEYTLRDTAGNTSSATAYAYVSTLPNLGADNFSIDEDTAAHSLDLLANDSDVDAGQTLTITAVTQPANGSVTLQGGDQPVLYTPNPNFAGVDTFTYTVSDGLVETTQTVTVNVTNTADTPTVTADTATVQEDGAVTLDVLANDSDVSGVALGIHSFGQGANGSVTQSGTQLIYTPNADFSGVNTFTYTATDGAGGTASTTVTVTVEAVNDAPTAPPVALTVNEDSSVTFDPLAQASDAEGNVITLSEIGTASMGEVTQNADGTVTFTPNADTNGNDSFSYVITDGDLSSTVTVSLTVTPVNDLPVVTDDTINMVEDSGSVILNVLSNDTDVEGPLTLTEVTGAQFGTVTFTADGDVTYTPDPDVFGEELLTYAVTDSNGATATATLNIAASAENDAPTVTDQSALGSENETQTVTPLSSAQDVDGDVLAVVAINGTALTPNSFVRLSNGADVWLNSDNTITLIPNSAYDHLQVGEMITETVTYSVSDGVAAPVVGNLNFSIVGENDLPSISPIDRLVVQSDTSTALDLSLLAIDDPDTDVLELSLSVTAGAIIANPDVPGVSVTVSAEGQITVAGQADALSAYLVDSVRFIDPADQALGQSAHLMVAVSDGTAPQEIAPIMIDVAGVAETARISGSLGV